MSSNHRRPERFVASIEREVWRDCIRFGNGKVREPTPGMGEEGGGLVDGDADEVPEAGAFQCFALHAGSDLVDLPHALSHLIDDRS